MRILIDIPEDTHERITRPDRLFTDDDINKVCWAVYNGTPIPDNATNERMVGSWIKSRDCYGDYHFTCSVCGNDIATQYADNWDDNYCSECGARMEGMEYEKGYTL